MDFIPLKGGENHEEETKSVPKCTENSENECSTCA